MKKLIIILLLYIFSCLTYSAGIEMRDYMTIRTGMSEGEVLYKFGNPDHETTRSDRLDFTLSKTWYYIPEQASHNKWITEIKFDSNGKVIKRERNRGK